MKTARSWRVADQPEDFVRFKVEPGKIAQREDGRRSESGPGQFEWWYADAILKNGAYVVVVFFTKPIDDQLGGLAPRVAISIAEPGKSIVTVHGDFAADALDGSPDGCAVKIGDNSFVGNLEAYTVIAKVDQVEVRLTLQRVGESLRFGTGHLLFGPPGKEKFFGWLPSVPRGIADVTYRIGNDPQVQSPGMGYHDHNWGDAPIGSLMHHWYWARASIDGYTVIAAHIAPQKRFGSDAFTLLYIEKDGKVLVSDNQHVAFTGVDDQVDPVTLKPVATLTSYTVMQGKTKFVVTFRIVKTLLQEMFDKTKPAPQDPEMGAAYHRFGGVVSLDIHDDGSKAEPPKMGQTLWELMYLGSAGDPNALSLYARSLTQAKPKS
jgi:hypothetical protein